MSQNLHQNLNAPHPVAMPPARADTATAGHPAGPTYAGVLSFMRRPYTRDLAGVDVAVSGIPLDLATTFRPGTRFGPAGMRAASVQLADLGAFPWGFDPFDHLNVVDYGDCYFDAHNPLGIRDAIVAHAREILATGTRMLTFGGDHYITYPLLIAHAEKFGKPLSLIHFDAHCDTWPDDNPDSLNHGTMFYKAIREGLVRILDAPWVHRNGTQATIDEVLSIVGDAPTYLTFDIDCLDPAFAPGTGTPVAGGLSSAQALEIVRALGAVNLVGADVVEVSPPYDHSDVTALAAAHLAADMLCLMRNQKLQRQQRVSVPCV
jgi:agmatinase